jgi:anti-anti-sigma regulatory factor
VVLLDAESIADIDSTAVGVLRDLIVEFRDDGIEFWAARVKTRVAEMMSRLGVDTDSRVYPTVGAAVAAFELLGAPDDGEASTTESTASSEGQAPSEG